MFEVFSGTHDIDGTGDTVKAALYGGAGYTGTPDEDANATTCAYNGTGGPWVVAEEVSDDPNWDLAGEIVTGLSLDQSTAGTVKWDGTNTPQSGATCTVAAVYGCLVYDDTDASDRGICFNYFGGSTGVTAGTYTIGWHASGIFSIAV
jgi:hypothetical protein